MNWFLFLKVDAVSRTRLKESCSYGVDRKSGRLGGREIIVRGDDDERTPERTRTRAVTVKRERRTRMRGINRREYPGKRSWCEKDREREERRG